MASMPTHTLPHILPPLIVLRGRDRINEPYDVLLKVRGNTRSIVDVSVPFSSYVVATEVKDHRRDSPEDLNSTSCSEPRIACWCSPGMRVD